jgi:hypothetical protein
MSRLVLVVVCIALFSAGAFGEEPVVLKKPEPWKVGDRVRYTETEKSKQATEFTVAGKKTAQNEDESKQIVYVQEVLTAPDKDGGKPLKLKRIYEKYEVSTAGKNEIGPPLNVPIVIEKKDKKYTFDAGEKKIDAEFVAKLDKEFNTPTEGGKEPTEFYPDKPVRPGDSWKLPPKELGLLGAGGDDGMKFDATKLVATGKLVKVFKRGDRPFALVEYTIAAPIKSLGKEDTLKLQEGQFSARFTIELALDGKAAGGTVTTTNTMSAKLAGAATAVSIALESTNTLTEEILVK